MFRGLLFFSSVLVSLLTWERPAQAYGNKLGLPDVPDAPAQTIEERGQSPVYYRLPDNSVSPWFRTVLGASSRLAVRGETEATRFTFDGLVGTEIGFSRTSPATFVTELGYSYVYESQHWFVLGAGPGLRRLGSPLFGDDDDGLRPTGPFGITLIPHGIVGTYEGHFAYGARTSLIVRFMTAGVEVAHQYGHIPELERSVHEIHFGFSVVFSSGDWD